VADELVAMNPEKKVVDNRIFLYYGEVSEIKGVKVLIEAFKNFSSRYANAELHIVGHLKGISDEDMRASIEGYPISYLGPMPYNEMIEKLDSVYAVVVPSIWQENYPNTVLESISRMKMVIGSDRGGIPELISNSDYIFVANDIDCLTVSMGKVYSLSDKAYANECRSVYEKVVISNSQSKYYDRVIRLAKSI
jgi:glycosyltransferase involved in cell wall biosynthesis